MRFRILPVLLVLLAALAAPAFAQTHTVTLTWTPGVPVAGASAADVSFNVYSAPGACAVGQTFTKINTLAVTSPTFTDTSAYLASGVLAKSFCYQVTAVAGSVPPATTGVEGPPSNQVTVLIPALPVLPPAPPVLDQPVVTSP